MDDDKTIDENKGDNAVYEMIASPVESNETQISNVVNNGHAMAAYMMCVGLWVLCIAFCIMYPLTEHHGKIKSGFSWWLSKNLNTRVKDIIRVRQAEFSPAPAKETFKHGLEVIADLFIRL